MMINKKKRKVRITKASPKNGRNKSLEEGGPFLKVIILIVAICAMIVTIWTPDDLDNILALVAQSAILLIGK